MRVLVCGGRDYRNRGAVYAALDDLHREKGVSAIIQGGARGADYIASLWARDRKVPCVRVDAEWSRHGRSAGPMRNQKMLDEQKPDLVVAFPGGKGTADMIRRATAGNVAVQVQMDVCQ